MPAGLPGSHACLGVTVHWSGAGARHSECPCSLRAFKKSCLESSSYRPCLPNRCPSLPSTSLLAEKTLSKPAITTCPSHQSRASSRLCHCCRRLAEGTDAEANEAAHVTNVMLSCAFRIDTGLVASTMVGAAAGLGLVTHVLAVGSPPPCLNSELPGQGTGF